jgi:hypothetical protein
VSPGGTEGEALVAALVAVVEAVVDAAAVLGVDVDPGAGGGGVVPPLAGVLVPAVGGVGGTVEPELGLTDCALSFTVLS